LLFNETDFLIMGGVDPDYKLSNKITMLTFQESRIWAYAHNKRPSIKKLASNGGGEASPKEAKSQPVPPQFRLAATNSFL
jgi:K+-transporting ATPase A subunit